MSRRDEIAARLADVRRRIADAAIAAGRDPAEVTLIAVTKGFPAADVARLAELGIRDVGENRDQEARAKLADLGGVDLRWHFVGQLQRNKARSVATYAHLVHSVDGAALATALAVAAERVGRALTVLVQVDLADRPSSGRGGVSPSAVLALAERIVGADGLRLGGVMTVAPQEVDPLGAFTRLAEISARLRAEHPGATIISAGMSGDLEAAVRSGATHVRVGTALLGSRPPHFG